MNKKSPPKTDQRGITYTEHREQPVKVDFTALMQLKANKPISAYPGTIAATLNTR